MADSLLGIITAILVYGPVIIWILLATLGCWVGIKETRRTKAVKDYFVNTDKLVERLYASFIHRTCRRSTIKSFICLIIGVVSAYLTFVLGVSGTTEVTSLDDLLDPIFWLRRVGVSVLFIWMEWLIIKTVFEQRALREATTGFFLGNSLLGSNGDDYPHREGDNDGDIANNQLTNR